MQSKSIFGALCLSFAACIWGGMFVVVKTIVGEISPISIGLAALPDCHHCFGSGCLGATHPLALGLA
ncbi:hypothetical protein LAC03_17570 [Levilactobacillus acidifarinae]|nr:hypothetical protein LAC03_17570 [Levilactobacillus acidifarinae]